MLNAKYFAAAALAVLFSQPVPANASTFTTLYSFTGFADGGDPTAPLTFYRGELYGSVPAYGANLNYMGSVFKVNASTGAYKAIYAFKGGTDGSGPANGVIYQNGTIYGTTFFGGGGCPNQGCGTIFSINAKSGSEQVLYSFSDDPNSSPVGAGMLLYQAGKLYGTTGLGGTYGKGSVFSFDPTTASFATLHNFTGGADGNFPNPQLLYENGLLYGTTQYGGQGCSHHHFIGGCGTIFTINPTTGSETVLRAFEYGTGGKFPYSNLIYHSGRLIGDTTNGGDRQSCGGGCGVSFAVKAATGNEAVLDTFATSGDGYTGLTLVHGMAYETRPYGGSGYGALAQLDLKSGQQTVLYTFTGGADGRYPQAPLTYHDGAFYGTTMGGGNQGCEADQGCGTVFKFVP